MAGNPRAVNVAVDNVDVLGEINGLLAHQGSAHIEDLAEVQALTGALGILLVVDFEHVLDRADTGDPLLEGGENLVQLVK